MTEGKINISNKMMCNECLCQVELFAEIIAVDPGISRS